MSAEQQQHILEIISEVNIGLQFEKCQLPNGISCKCESIDIYEDDYQEYTIYTGSVERYVFEFSQYSIFIDFAAKNYSNMPELPNEIDKLIPLWGKLESYPLKEQVLQLVDGMYFDLAYQILSGHEG